MLNTSVENKANFPGQHPVARQAEVDIDTLDADILFCGRDLTNYREMDNV